MSEEKKDWGTLTKITGMTRNEALAYQLAQKAAKYRICPDAKATTYVGPQDVIDDVNVPKPKAIEGNKEN